MADKYYTLPLGTPGINFATDSFVAIPCGAGSTVLTDDPTSAGLAQFGTLAELTAGNWQRIALTNTALAPDFIAAPPRGEWDWDDLLWQIVSGAVAAILICKDPGGGDASFIPIVAFDQNGADPAGGDFDADVSAEGAVHWRQA